MVVMIHQEYNISFNLSIFGSAIIQYLPFWLNSLLIKNTYYSLFNFFFTITIIKFHEFTKCISNKYSFNGK